MGKSVAAMVGAFLVGGGAMGAFSGVLGPFSESAALGAVGITLFAAATVLTKLAGAVQPVRNRETAKA